MIAPTTTSPGADALMTMSDGGRSSTAADAFTIALSMAMSGGLPLAMAPAATPTVSAGEPPVASLLETSTVTSEMTWQAKVTVGERVGAGGVLDTLGTPIEGATSRIASAPAGLATNLSAQASGTTQLLSDAATAAGTSRDAQPVAAAATDLLRAKTVGEGNLQPGAADMAASAAAIAGQSATAIDGTTAAPSGEVQAVEAEAKNTVVDTDVAKPFSFVVGAGAGKSETAGKAEGSRLAKDALPGASEVDGKQASVPRPATSSSPGQAFSAPNKDVPMGREQSSAQGAPAATSAASAPTVATTKVQALDESIAEPLRSDPSALATDGPIAVATGPSSDTAPPAASHQGNSASPAWQTLPTQMVRMVERGVDRMRVALDPVALGAVEVELEIDRGGKVRARLAADRPETLQILQRDARVLQQALSVAGVDLADGGLSFSLRDGSGHGGGFGQPADGRPHTAGGDSPTRLRARNTVSEPRRAVDGLLDLTV